MIKNNKKIIITFLFIFITMFCAGNIKATDTDVNEKEIHEVENKLELDNNGIMDSKFIDGVYKNSDETNEIYLPFFRYAKNRITIDKEISKMGMIFSGDSIEVDAPLKGGQVLFSSGTIRISSSMEYGIIMANGNVIIDSDIQRPIVIFSTGTITITENATVSEDILCVADTIGIKGTVKGSIIGLVTSCNVSGDIERDLRINTQNLEMNTVPKGNVYVRTYNKEISEKYPDIRVDLIENKENDMFSVKKTLGIITKYLVFSLIYVLINKISNKKLFENFLQKAKANTSFVILSGAIALMLSLPIVFVLITLSILGLGFIAIPVMVAYFAFIIVVAMLSTFIVACTLFNYIKDKYLKNSGIGTDIIGVFFTLVGLYLLSLIPYLGWYISVAYLIFAIGLVLALIFKRKK